MKHVEISYQNLQGADPAYVEKLTGIEHMVRRALEEMGRQDTSVRWLSIEDELHNHVFQLVASDDEVDCILQVAPLDLTLEPDEFERMLTEGRRSCTDVVHRGGDREQAK
jgi:hypothetical protein